MRTIIRGATVLTMVGETPLQADLSIEDGVITAVGEVSGPADREIDAEGKLLMPGLINAHTHMAMSLFRNYAEGLPLHEWLTEKIWPAEAELRAEDVYDGTLLAIAESIRSGVTTFNDMYFFCDEVVRATEVSGMRGVINRGIVSSPDVDDKIRDAVKLAEDHHGTLDGRIQVMLAPHAPYTCDRKTLEILIDRAKALGLRIHIHVSETKREQDEALEHFGMTPVAYLESIGLFEVPVVMAHGVHVTPEDLEILSKYDVHLVHNPESNLKLASGFCPVSAYLDKGINVAIGTDGASSNNNLNLFEEMHVTAILHKALAQDPTVLSPMTVLRMATINGARALGIDDLVGTIEVGKRADLILVDLDKAHLRPLFDPAAALVYSAQAADVSLVMVDGRILMEEGVLTTLDEEAVIARGERAAFELVKRGAKA